jgi:uncharacterized membrane protein
VSDRRRPALVWALIVLLVAEFALAATIAATLLIELLTAPAASFASAVALTVLGLIAAGWLGAIVVGTLRGRAWVRSAVVVWQVLQFAIGAASIAGQFGQPWIGWPLVVVALLVFVLLFTKPVVAATADRGRRDPAD